MGCINSKHLLKFSSSPSKDYDHNHHIEPLATIENRIQDKDNEISKDTSNADSINLKFEGRLMDAEHVAAGWPSWLSEVAGEAVHGWLPIKSDNFERLEKV